MNTGTFEKRINFDNLPKKKGSFQKIDWENSVGHIAEFIYDNISGEVEIVGYKKGIVSIKYLDYDIFNINIAGLRKCALGKMLNRYTKDYKIEIGKTFIDEKRNITIINREYRLEKSKDGYNKNEKYYLVHCNICNADYWVVENTILKIKCGCPCCAGKIVVPGINDIPTTAPWMVKYFQGGYDEAKLYNCNNTTKITFKCPICGKLKNKKIAIYSLNTYRFSCDYCSDGISYPEKIMMSVFDQIGIEYATQYKPKWSDGKYYDFYIKNDGIIVETHGHQHYKECFITVGSRSLEEEIANDEFKMNTAIINNIDKYIVIDCRYSDLNYIKNSIINSIGEIYSLSGVDWVECEKFSNGSMVYEVCNYFDNNKNNTPKDLSIIFNLSEQTIRTWLKRGTNIGICNYIPSVSNSIGGYKSWETRRKRQA